MNELTEYLLIAGFLIALLLLGVFSTVLLAQSSDLLKKLHLSIPPETVHSILNQIKEMLAQRAVEMADRTSSKVDDEVAKAVVEQLGYTLEWVDGKPKIVERK